MSANYAYQLLPLDTPEDDPLWAAYLDIFSLGFLEPRRPPEAVAIYQQRCRADRARLGMVTAEGPGLAGRQPVAAFAAIPSTINCGAGLVEGLIVSAVVVRASHRRQGLLRLMMREQLDAARNEGKALAVLTASEATIYGRFGFGMATRSFAIAIDTRRFSFHSHAEVASGSIEFVHPEFLQEHHERICRSHQERHRGAVGFHHGHWLADTAQWDSSTSTPSQALRALVHFDESGTPDGFALFTHKGIHKGIETSPTTAEVHLVVSSDPATDRALWQGLANIDLVNQLTYEMFALGDPLTSSLNDPWAIKFLSEPQPTWLRILDLPLATAQRRFDGEGSVVVQVTDEMGYLEGTWRISAENGVGSATRVSEDSEVILAANVLARLWHGDCSPLELSHAGLIRGEHSAIRRLAKLMWVAEPPSNLSTF